jgi:energy-coupling factor transporter ATP-binding protein EcfA2
MVARASRSAPPPRASAAVAVRSEADLIVPPPEAFASPARREPDASELLRAVLEEIGLYVTDYVSFPSRSAVVAVLGWMAHAAARDSKGDLIWRASPRLLPTSRESGSGKSTLLDILAILLQSRAGRLVKVTPYGLAKIVGALKEVALPDDAQVSLSKDIIPVLLGGYSRGGTWASGKGKGTLEPVYGAVALAGKDEIITARAQESGVKDLLARSIIIRMERSSSYMPELDEEAEERGAELAKMLEAVIGACLPLLQTAAKQLAAELRGVAVTDPDGARTAQIWRPLHAVYRVAGGPFVAAGHQAAEELTAAAGDLLAVQDALTGLTEQRTQSRSFWDSMLDS